MLAIVVVNQSIMEWPPLQDNRLSTRPASFRNTLRQGRRRGFLGSDRVVPHSEARPDPVEQLRRPGRRRRRFHVQDPRHFA